jgi:hypothetical protein
MSTSAYAITPLRAVNKRKRLVRASTWFADGGCSRVTTQGDRRLGCSPGGIEAMQMSVHQFTAEPGLVDPVSAFPRADAKCQSRDTAHLWTPQSKRQNSPRRFDREKRCKAKGLP